MGKVSIVIVNCNGKRFLSECPDGLRQQIYKPLSITLVDNDSNDRSVDFVKRDYPEVKTIALPKDVGFAAASNIALRTVQTEYVVLLNNDQSPILCGFRTPDTSHGI